ncbi:hypothetical protein UFOVP141_56 [uncultured Caudovirales phage]|uniref:Uncharacterized protein n=1 Tax=uncultured Caudovirales phage TaxID=2100421 RepID=A0A6J7VPS8_9CAUD|nr:hypothetical protein UFOVP141_56 [uncultured Caudovirales phage]
MRVQLCEITIPRAKFFTPRLEPAYVVPILRHAWKDQTPDEDGVVATPIPFCREINVADEWDRLVTDYGDSAKSVHVSDHHLKTAIDEEAAKFAKSGLVPVDPSQLSGNIALTMRPNVRPAAAAKQAVENQAHETSVRRVVKSRRKNKAKSKAK